MSYVHSVRDFRYESFEQLMAGIMGDHEFSEILTKLTIKKLSKWIDSCGLFTVPESLHLLYESNLLAKLVAILLP
jgi:hypothetical protein